MPLFKKKKKKKWKRHQSSLSLHHTRTRWRSNWLQARKKVLIRNQISQHLDLGPPSLQNCAQIYFSNLRPPVYGTFVMAEKSKTNIQKWHPFLPLGTVILFCIFFFFYNSRYFRICSYTYETLFFTSCLTYMHSCHWHFWRVELVLCDRHEESGRTDPVLWWSFQHKQCMTLHV